MASAATATPTPAPTEQSSATIDALVTSLPSVPAHVPGTARTPSLTPSPAKAETKVASTTEAKTAATEASLVAAVNEADVPATIVRTGNELCVVFDLNGTLVIYTRHQLYIPDGEKKADVLAGRQRRWGTLYLRFRPHLDQLFDLLFEKLNARVGVWTFSGKGPVAKELMTATFGKYASRVEFCYDATKCSPENRKLKDLNLVWGDNPEWRAHRTLLVDDDAYKTKMQTQNAVVVPSFEGEPKGDNDFVLTLIAGLKKAHEATDVRVKEKSCNIM